jgi:hypothetical protein
MEIRLNTHGPNSLATKVFFSDESGFEVASVIVTGKTDAVLLDAQWTLSNAYRVAAEILETGKYLKTIYINSQFFGKVEHWEEVIGPINVPRKAVNIEPLAGNYFELEGHRIEIIPEVMGDMKYNTVVWIPSIKTLYGSDVLFNQAHPFTCEVTAEERRQWIKDIERLETMGAEVIIPGHQKPGMPFDASSLNFTRDYVIATDEELAKTNDVAGFYYAMVKRFPDANLFISNEMNANVFKGDMDWNWREA